MSCLPGASLGHHTYLEPILVGLTSFQATWDMSQRFQAHILPQNKLQISNLPWKPAAHPRSLTSAPFQNWWFLFGAFRPIFQRLGICFYFQRVNLQQAEAPPFRFTGPQTSCTEVEKKNAWKSDQTNKHKHLNSIKLFSKMNVSRQKNGGFCGRKRQKSHVMSWPPTISSPPKGSRGANNPHLEETSCCHAGCLHRLDARIQVAHPQLVAVGSIFRLDFWGSTSYPSLRNLGNFF